MSKLVAFVTGAIRLSFRCHWLSSLAGMIVMVGLVAPARAAGRR